MIQTLAKNGIVSGSFFRQKFICYTLSVLYSKYNTVGRTIASIYDLGGIFTSVLRDSVHMLPRVIRNTIVE